AVEPYLRVLAVRSFGSLPVLLFETGREAMVIPFELLVAETGDLERLRPLVVARDVLVGAEQQVEPATKKEIPVGADRILLQPPGLDAVTRPAEAVVLAAQIRRQRRH